MKIIQSQSLRVYVYPVVIYSFVVHLVGVRDVVCSDWRRIKHALLLNDPAPIACHSCQTELELEHIALGVCRVDSLF